MADGFEASSTSMKIDGEPTRVPERRVWRRQNLPLPEPHLAGLAIGLILHSVRPRRLGGRAEVRLTGAGLVTVGAVAAAWATASAGRCDLEQPQRLLTDGAYAHSRNPMYVGWTVAYLGAAAILDTAWPLLLLPGVAAAVHREVRREEERLATRFGADFEVYAARVRRYV